VIGGAAGIGLETARLARAQGAALVLAARNLERLQQVASELATASTAAFDVTDFERLAQFFDELPAPIDHLLLTGPGPYSAPLANSILKKHAATSRPTCFSHCKSLAASQTRFTQEEPCSSWEAPVAVALRRIRSFSALTAAMPAMTKNLALELAPVRVNLIAAGFVDTPLSASILGNQLDARREQLRTTLPIRRVVGPADVATLAVHIMTNAALTGATFDIDGGQQLAEG
jgi:NAD(P)-dependent dehydrogenase (short-subunit alcohol dehydrogenase family)